MTLTQRAPDLQPQVTERTIAMTATRRTQTELLADCLDTNTPVLLTGAPGTAKTATIEALAAERGWYLEVVIASAQDPTTILGIPMPSEDRKHTEQTIPGWARRINEAAAAGRTCILFLDELSSVPGMVSAPLLGVVQSRRADGWTLPADCRIVAAQNPPDLAVNGAPLEAAMANRWAHIAWQAPRDEWMAWASASDSPTLRLVSEFVQAVPDMLLAVPMRERSAAGTNALSGAWPSPRSWTNGARLADLRGDYSVMALTVGTPAAQAFQSWASMRDVPTVEQLLAGAALPTRSDAFRVAVNAVADAVTAETLTDTLTVLRAGIAMDAGLVAEATLRVARGGHIAGIEPLVSDLRQAGIDFAALAMAAQS